MVTLAEANTELGVPVLLPTGGAHIRPGGLPPDTSVDVLVLELFLTQVARLHLVPRCSTML